MASEEITARRSMFILRKLPRPLIEAPERMALKFASMLIGIGTLLGVATGTGSLARLPDFIEVEIGITFALGGLLSLVGIIIQFRPVERLGVGLTAFGAATYGIALFAIFGPSRWVGGVIFLALSFACLLRLLVSTASAKVILALWLNAARDKENS